MTSKSVLDEHKENLTKLFEKTTENTEFEFDLNMDKKSMTYEKYIAVMKYLTFMANLKKLELKRQTSLDIAYSDIINETIDNYRITILGKDLINKYVSMFQTRRNHVMFNALINIIKDKQHTDALTVYQKSKQYENMIDIPDFNTRVRLSSEDLLTQQDLNHFKMFDDTSSRKIIFRYKQRLSVILEQTKDYVIRVDLTNAKTSQNVNKIDINYPTYELEIEYTQLSTSVPKKNILLDKVISLYYTFLRVLQQSNYIITKTHADRVLEEYKRLLNISDKTSFNLEGRQPVSLEIQYATELLANRYAVVDKADGDRYFMIICFGHVYLISQNLKVKDTGINLKTAEYDGTIFDCEYIFLPKYKRYAILPFDCLFAKNEDIRKNPLLMERLEIAKLIINKCFIFGKQKGFTQKPMKGQNTVDNFVVYHIGQLDAYIEALLHDLDVNTEEFKEKQFPLIRAKYFIPVNGLADNEIFKYSMILWNKYMYDTVKYPYLLDGLIYQPLNQTYETNLRESKFSDYKWKPPEKNTIDFYIRFEKDNVTKRPINVFDNSNEEKELNKPYRICYLHNGKRTRDGETPIFFNETEKLYIAHLQIQDGNVNDINGDIIQDETVVEFYYNNSMEVNERFRWVPLKTRYDKTEMVNKYKMKYGNSSDVASRIWRSIIVPVKISDIAELSDDEMYLKHLNEMKSKITHELIISAAKENAYYQVKTNLAKPMRNFHNWIKSVTIFTYMNRDYLGYPAIVLDIGCGRGGDLMKFYHAKIAYGVCFDVDYETLHSTTDGALSRYSGLRKKYPAFPKISIMCADFTAPLDVESQTSVVQDKSQTNKMLLEKYFPKSNMTQFDCLNAQFSFHYFLGSDKTWENACANINKCLKVGGIMIITTFDAQRVLEVLGNSDKYTLYCTIEGEKKMLMDIVRKFPQNKTSGLGMAIDVYNYLISNEGVYNTEYLVDKQFLINEFKEKCNMELVDTELFDHLFEIHRDNITRVSEYDDKKETKKFLQEVATFYDQSNELNAECFKITRLNRYYVFRKMAEIKTTKTKK